MSRNEAVSTGDAQKQALNEWANRLATSLQNLTGVRPSLRWAGPANVPGDSPFLWRDFASADSDIRIHVGAGESSWRALAARVISSNPSIEAYLDARQIYVNLLEQSSQQKGAQIDPGPSGVQFELMELHFPGQQPVKLLLGTADDGLTEADSSLGLLANVELPVTIRFGTTYMYLQELAGLEVGTSIGFDRGMDDAVDILVNGRVVARGDAVVVRGNYGIRITEVVSAVERMNSSFTVVRSTNGPENIQRISK